MYETLRELDESSDTTDIEERAGMALLDEENLRGHTFELDPALADAMGSQPHLGESVLEDGATQDARRETSKTRRTRWLPRSPGIVEADDIDDEVPMSLLVEGNRNGTGAPVTPGLHSSAGQQIPSPIPALGHSSGSTRAKWQATQHQQRLYQDSPSGQALSNPPYRASHPLAMIDPREKAMWRWANVENLDNFLRDVYDYFVGNGIWSILLSRILNLL